MAFFRGAKREDEQPAETASGDALSVSPIDFSKRYDIYCHFFGEERLYENVRIVGIRTMEKQRPHSVVIGGYIEIEDLERKRVMIPQLHINVLCEHGVEAGYKVLRTWGRPRRPA